MFKTHYFYFHAVHCCSTSAHPMSDGVCLFITLSLNVQSALIGQPSVLSRHCLLCSHISSAAVLGSKVVLFFPILIL